MNAIPINLAVEDELSEAVARRIITCSGRPYHIGSAYGHTGFGYLKKRIKGFNNAAKGTPFLVLTDLDRAECPRAVIGDWFGNTSKHSNLLLCIAVKEVEAWLMADRAAFARFTGIREGLMPHDVDAIPDPKDFLINLVGASRRRALREDIVPPAHSRRPQGPDYNGRLAEFVHKYWNPQVAADKSPSLRRAVHLLDKFMPSG